MIVECCFSVPDYLRQYSMLFVIIKGELTIKYNKYVLRESKERDSTEMFHNQTYYDQP